MIGPKVFIRHALSPVNEISQVRPLKAQLNFSEGTIGLQGRWFPVEKATRLSECRRAVLLKPETAAAKDGLRSVNSTPKRANVESEARAKPPAKEIITSSRDSIAVTKTIGVYLNSEATTRFPQESTVATRTQPTNGVRERPATTHALNCPGDGCCCKSMD